MNTQTAIRNSIVSTDFIISGYLEDLTDADLLVRPVPGANHIAWQLGHLIKSENAMLNAAFPGSMPALPPGFAEKHTTATSGLDDPSAFHTKDEYLRLYREQRAATLQALAGVSDADFDKPAPDQLKHFIENIGSLFLIQGSHWMMHAGQWAIVRRKLGRKPLF